MDPLIEAIDDFALGRASERVMKSFRDRRVAPKNSMVGSSLMALRAYL
jgi:hypothetical protein